MLKTLHYKNQARFVLYMKPFSRSKFDYNMGTMFRYDIKCSVNCAHCALQNFDIEHAWCLML